MRNIVLLSMVLLAVAFILPLLAMSGEPLYTPLSDEQIQPSDTPSPPAPTPAPPVSADIQPSAGPLPSDSEVRLTVRVDGEVKEMNLHDYLCGVTAAEIPASFPAEAIKAQVIAARTFTYYTMNQNKSAAGSHEGAQLCDDSAHCQAYITPAQAQTKWGNDTALHTQTIQSAVEQTDAEVVLYEGQPILAVFHDSSSGQTERAVDVWGEDYPYLQSVESPGGDAAPRYFGEVEVSADTFWQIIRAAQPEAQPGGAVFSDYVYTGSGAVHSVKVGGAILTGTQLRALFGLRSTHFTVAVRDGKVIFMTEGYGHGVGLSQYGARALALEGKSAWDILRWYYPHTHIGKYDGAAREVFLEN